MENNRAGEGIKGRKKGLSIQGVREDLTKVTFELVSEGSKKESQVNRWGKHVAD